MTKIGQELFRRAFDMCREDPGFFTVEFDMPDSIYEQLVGIRKDCRELVKMKAIEFFLGYSDVSLDDLKEAWGILESFLLEEGGKYRSLLYTGTVKKGISTGQR